MQEVSVNHEIGSTAGQTIVASGQAVAQAEGDVAGARYNDSGSSGEGGYWKSERGTRVAPEDNLRLSKEQRLHALENDGTHFSAPHYKYDTSRSTEARDSRKRRDAIRLTFTGFDEIVPPHVTEREVQRVAQSREAPSELRPYGGLRFVAVLAIVEVWGASNEELFTNEDFREQFREEFAEAQVSSSKALRKVFELREVEE